MAKKKRERPEKHKQTLGEQIEDPTSYGVRTKPRPQKRRRSKAAEEALSEEEDDSFVPDALSGRILDVAREQQREIDVEEDVEKNGASVGVHKALASAMQQLGPGSGVADDDSDSDDGLGFEGNFPGPEEDYGNDWEDEITAEDEIALAAFMAPNAKDYHQKTLNDIIMEKIRDKNVALDDTPRAGLHSEGTGDGFHIPDLDPKVVEVYQGIGQVMSRFTSGKIPKAFKVIPNLRNWEDILFLTEPEMWSPHAVFQGTRLFVSNLNTRMAQRFLNLVLLPHMRRDIQENKRLHFALFQALKKATFKPGAFYKGILLPLCASGTCTLREAVILSSVIKRCSIPVLHSAAALLRIAEMPYSGVNSFFIRVLLDKRYALPYRVIDALVDHFTSFSKEERLLPVVWHQSLLTFIQRYKSEIRREDKDALRALCKHQPHYAMTPEVLRELDSSRSRGEKADGISQKLNQDIGKHVHENIRDLAPLVLMDD